VAIFQPFGVFRHKNEAPLRSNSFPSLVYLVAKLLAIAVLSFKILMLALDRSVWSKPDSFRSLKRGDQKFSTSFAVEYTKTA
jgi:hypothetical protein